MHFKTFLFFTIFLINCNYSFACPVGSPGQFDTVEELLDESKNVFLVKLVNNIDSEIIEVLKGDKLEYKPIKERLTDKGVHYNSDFGNHTDLTFWEFTGVGRGVPLLCGADFTFVPGESYLLFQDLYGSVKYAEVIRNPHDKWYLYVKNKISNPDFDKYKLLESIPNDQSPIHHGTWTVNWESTFTDASNGIEYDCSFLGASDCSKYKVLIEFDNNYIHTQYLNSNNQVIGSESKVKYKYRRFNEQILIQKIEPYTGRDSIVLKIENNHMKYIENPGGTIHLYKNN